MLAICFNVQGGKTMNALRITAVVGVVVTSFLSPAFAQNSDAAAAQAAMEKAVTNMGLTSQPPAAPAAHDKADAAMTTQSSLPTEADRKAAAAMSK
jgi:hypothetical protein